MLNIHDVHVNRFKREKRKYPIVLIISCNSSSYVIIRYQPFIDCFIHVKSYYVRNLIQSQEIVIENRYLFRLPLMYFPYYFC